MLTIQDLPMGLNSRSPTDAILLDFSKAFDKVPHQLFSLKLHYYGIHGNGNILEWVKIFLDGITQQIVLDGTASSVAPVILGTVLDALIFFVHINTLPYCVKLRAFLFADDCVLCKRINSSADANALQEDINNLQQWEKDWQVKFNPD